MGTMRHHGQGPSLMSTEVRVDVEAFVEIIAYLEDLAGRMRGDREMFGEREASDAEDHVTYLIHALQELTPDALDGPLQYPTDPKSAVMRWHCSGMPRVGQRRKRHRECAMARRREQSVGGSHGRSRPRRGAQLYTALRPATAREIHHTPEGPRDLV